jgi:hypothetical protein
MSSNRVSTEHVSVVVFVSWAKTYYWTAVWSGTYNSPKSIWLKIWCFLKADRLWTRQNLKGRILHWLFWRNRWYWIIYLIKQITSLKVWLLIVAYVCWRFWPYVFGSYGVIQVSSVGTVCPRVWVASAILLRGHKSPVCSCGAHCWHFSTLFFMFISNGLALWSRPWEANGDLDGEAGSPPMEPESTFPYSQEPATLSYPEPGESSPCPHILFVSYQTYLCLCLSSCLFILVGLPSEIYLHISNLPCYMPSPS